MAFEQTFATAARPLVPGDVATDPSEGKDHAVVGPTGRHTSVRFGHRRFDVMAVACVFLAYTATLYVANGRHMSQSVLGGFANTIPVVLFGGAARWAVMHRLVGRSPWRQVAGHFCLGAVFSLLALWLLLVLLGMVNDLSPVHFKVAPFTAGGNAWQFLENVTTYVVIALLAYVQALQRAATRSPAATPQPPGPAGQPQDAPPRPAKTARHFIRRGEDLLPVDLDRIVCITGADDYSAVSTLDRTHLVKMTLTEFAQVLDPARFLRVHRSAIVNLECVERAESAGGGRMLVHMSNGQTIKASRAGSQLLRTRII